MGPHISHFCYAHVLIHSLAHLFVLVDRRLLSTLCKKLRLNVTQLHVKNKTKAWLARLLAGSQPRQGVIVITHIFSHGHEVGDGPEHPTITHTQCIPVGSASGAVPGMYVTRALPCCVLSVFFSAGLRIIFACLPKAPLSVCAHRQTMSRLLDHMRSAGLSLHCWM